jgi:2-C-methyl-D-erythritol 4-phosphate cytidylyltransferase
MKIDAVVVAGGSGARFGSNKLLAPIFGKPVLERAMCALLDSAAIGRIVVSGPPDLQQCVATVARAYPDKTVLRVAGGQRRRDSVEAGLRACTSRYVAIHDGARPLVDPRLVERLVAAAEGQPGAILATPVTDTIKEVSGAVITGHPDRSHLWAAQTPQVVLRQAWLDAASMSDNDETDDAAMLDRLGLQCLVVESDGTNLKITRPWDVIVAEAILRERDES